MTLHITSLKGAYNRLPNKSLLGAFAAVFLLFGILYAFYAFSDREPVILPEQFVAARNNAALVSRDIVALANETNGTLTHAVALDPKKNYREMLSLFERAQAANAAAYSKAFVLSEHLRELAGTLGGVSRTSSQRIALEAIGTELGLVTEFIAYTKSVNEFLDMLSYSTPDEIESRAQEAENLLRAVTASAQKINGLNSDFLKTMGKFDKSLQ